MGGFLSHCRVTNKAILFCFLGWDSVDILRENRDLFIQPKSSASKLPRSSRQEAAPQPFPTQVRKPEDKLPHSMEVLTLWCWSWSEKPSEQWSWCVEAHVFTLVLGRQQKRSILGERKPSESWVDLHGSCRNSRDPGNHPSQEENTATCGPSTLAPGWGALWKAEQGWGSIAWVPRSFLAWVQKVICGSGEGHLLLSQQEFHLIIQSYVNIETAKHRVQTKWLHSHRNHYLLAEISLFSLSVSNASLPHLYFIIENHISQKIDFDPSVTSKGSYALNSSLVFQKWHDTTNVSFNQQIFSPESTASTRKLSQEQSNVNKT